MNETEAIVNAWKDAKTHGKPMVLATVVRVRGSAYRRPGARMLITPDGWQAGGISGGCLEGDVLRKAWWRTENERAVVVSYDSTVPEDEADDDLLSYGFGLGCNGVVDVLLERVPSDDDLNCPVSFLERCWQMREVGVVATVIGDEDNQRRVGQRLFHRPGDESKRAHGSLRDEPLGSAVWADGLRVSEPNGTSETRIYADENGAAVEVFIERVTPPTPLVIFGAGHDVAPLALLAKTIGWHVTVVDPRPGARLASPERFPGADAVVACASKNLPSSVPLTPDTFAVVMSHNLLQDADSLRVLLPSPVRYIGVLGPRRRTEKLLASLDGLVSTLPLGTLDRLHAPLGLDLGGETPQAIALSALGEMQAVLSHREGGFLRDRALPIHNVPSLPTVALPSLRETATCALSSPVPAAA